jgi:hypothetical protein
MLRIISTVQSSRGRAALRATERAAYAVGPAELFFTADDAAGAHWTRHILDPGGIAAADCKIGDFHGDRRPAIACSGASTKNVKLYIPR